MPREVKDYNMNGIDDDEALVQEAREQVELWEDRIKRASRLDVRRCQQKRQQAKAELGKLLRKLGKEEDD